MRRDWVLRNEGLLFLVHDPEDWALDQVFAAGELTFNNGAAYLCTAAHTAIAAYEPGTGADWEDVFRAIGSVGPQGIQGIQGAPGGTLAWKGPYSAEAEYAANDGVLSSEGRAFYALQNTTGNAPPSYPTTSNDYWSLFAEKGADGADGADGDFQADGSVAMTGALILTQISTPSEPGSGLTGIYSKSDGKLYYFPEGGSETEVGSGSGGSGGVWSDMPAAVTRVSDTSFSMPDADNANLYDKMFDPGTIIRWEKSGGGNQFAVITAASYSSDVVTYTILGNTLSAGFSDVKYCIHKAMQEINIMPGTNPRAAETGVGKTILLPYDVYVFGARIRYGTAPTTTKGVWDINDDGTSIFTTKPEIAASATMGSWQVADCLLATALTAVVADSLITTDYDSGHATTPGADAYVRILFMPVAWRYRT